jgi:endonuclease/exonuclease/phosphatase family metal-dependent hydrolase
MRCWVALLLAACTVHRTYGDDDDGPHSYPPPRTDVVPAVGNDATLEIATWNLHNFPSDAMTAATVADLIASLDVDIVVTEEIANVSAWTELVERLVDYEAVLSTHEYSPGMYQKLGLLYRRGMVTAGAPTLLFESDSYAFPRPPLAVDVTVDGATVELVGVHLKAGVTDSDAARRTDAVMQLDAMLRMQVDGGGESAVVLLGDYNNRVDDPTARAVLAPLLDAPDRYTLRTDALAVGGGETYLGFGGEFIDHITTTAALDHQKAWNAAHVVVPPLDAQVAQYRDLVSDHLPVVIIVPRPATALP